MPFEPFSELDQLQGELRAVVKALADTVTTIANMGDVPDDARQGHIEREITRARGRIKELRLQERLLCDQAAATIERASHGDEPPIWSGRTFARAAGTRQPERINEAVLVELVKANTIRLLEHAPAPVLLYRLRAAILTKDRATEDGIKIIILRRVMDTGQSSRLTGDDPIGPVAYFLQQELGSVHEGYAEELEKVLQTLADADESRLTPEARQARGLVVRGAHRRPPLDLRLLAGDDRLMQVVVEKLGSV